MHTVFALLCFVVVIHWLIFPYPSGLLHWHCGNLTIAPVPAKQPWWIWINTSCEVIMNDCITTTKQSTTKPCAYFLGYTMITVWRIWLGDIFHEIALHVILACIYSTSFYHYDNPDNENPRKKTGTYILHSVDIMIAEDQIIYGGRASAAVIYAYFSRKIPVSVTKHDDVITWKHFPRHWPFVRGIHQSRDANFWCFSLTCAWINGWVNIREAVDLRRHPAHYDVTVTETLKVFDLNGMQSIVSNWFKVEISQPLSLEIFLGNIILCMTALSVRMKYIKNHSSWKTRVRLSYMGNIMDADKQATPEFTTSSFTIWSDPAGIFKPP